MLLKPGEGRSGPAVQQTECLCDGREYELRLPNAREIDEADPVGEPIGEAGHRRLREARFADTCRANKAEEPDIRRAELLLDRVKLDLPAQQDSWLELREAE